MRFVEGDEPQPGDPLTLPGSWQRLQDPGISHSLWDGLLGSGESTQGILTMARHRVAIGGYRLAAMINDRLR